MGPRVLVVCTANICRSPAAARLLAGRLGSSIEVVSRGTRSVPGAGMCQVSANWVLMNGGDAAGGHQSQPLELADVKASTLILTATQRHRAKVIELRPSAQVRTFTLAQAARITQWRIAQPGSALPGMPAGMDLPDRLLWLAEELDANRGAAPRPVPESADDLPDPHHGADHAEVFGALLAAVDSFCAPLLDPSARPSERARPPTARRNRRPDQQTNRQPDQPDWPDQKDQRTNRQPDRPDWPVTRIPSTR
jgi:low molecular weight protein-tyrosine phosphatase